MKKMIPIGIVFMILSAGASRASEMRKTEEKTFQIPDGRKVVVIADEGGVSIESWDKSEVFVTVTKKSWSRRKNRAEKIMDKIRVEMTLEGNTLTVREPEDQRRRGSELSELFRGDWFGDGEGYSIDYSLKVPRDTDVRAESDEGDVACSGTSGSLNLFADEGQIRAESVEITEGKIEADEGEIRLRSVRCSGNLTLGADEGEVLLEDVQCFGVTTAEADEGELKIDDSKLEELNASVDEGTVVLRNVQSKKFSISADEGDIEADFTPEPSGSYEIETDEGEVRLWVPENASLRVEFETEGGRTSSDFHLSRRETDSGETMTGSIGGGEGKLNVSSGEGDISLLKRSSHSSQNP